jgi:putative transposase
VRRFFLNLCHNFIINQNDKILLVYESKLEGTHDQYKRLDEAISTGCFVRNSIIRAWMDNQIKSRNDAYKHCKILANNPEFPYTV